MPLGLNLTTQNQFVGGLRNLLPNSRSFGPWDKGPAGNVVYGQPDPLGGATATKCVQLSDSNYGSYIQQFVGFSARQLTASMYAKQAEKHFLWFSIYADGAHHMVWFDLATGTVGTQQSGATGAIWTLGNGWYRIAVTVTAAAPTGYFAFQQCDADNDGNCTGSGTQGLYVWGPQLEYGARPTTYRGTGVFGS